MRETRSVPSTSIGERLGLLELNTWRLFGVRGQKAQDRAWLVLIAPSLLLLVLFFILPLIGVLRTSLYPGARSFGAEGFSLEHYVRIASDPFFLDVLIQTVVDGLVVAIASVFLGFPIGYSLARLPPKKRRWRLMLVIVPLTLSLVVIVFGWIVILGRSGMLNQTLLGLGLIDRPLRLLYNRGAVLLVLLQQFLPYMILSAMSVCSKIDPVLEQAAANLRANRLTTFSRVIIPVALPGIMSGMTLVFILTVSAFITPRLVGGGNAQMLGSIIFEQVTVALNWPLGATLAIVLLVVTTLVIAATNILITSKSAQYGRASIAN
ncbi:ABC transporter permease [Bradyrhizobium sp. USDA 4486]